VISNNKVLVIPDGILYNLSFETLTSEKINSFQELAAKSLLAKHTISYQYSLFLLNNATASASPDKNFVAFAPGFSDQIKNDYRLSRDTFELDKGYLSLLPQPFTISLATKAKDLFNGSIFIYDQSTPASFRNNAGQHKIIHIGTHAEADNLHPEFSRLIFAKNTKARDENNSLYLSDIYNCDLSSLLTVLTACETGTPGYEDGEGMISLAHAFSYAGSESIITSLAKVDEQSSAEIMDLFYENLLKGLPKDEALRTAKLTYLSTSEGRLLEPQYWAGLILIGDVSPIKVEQKTFWFWMVIAALIALVAMIVMLSRRKEKKVVKKFLKEAV
jgi:CHAT domain-containing protein